jgi:hypothetical protein
MSVSLCLPFVATGEPFVTDSNFERPNFLTMCKDCIRHPTGWKCKSKKLTFELITALIILSGLLSATVPSPGFENHYCAMSFGLFAEASKVGEVLSMPFLHEDLL